MSTPLFIQTPFAGNNTVPIVGEDLSAYADTDTFHEITNYVLEPTLVDELAWCATRYSTLEGQLIVGITESGYNWRLVGAYDIPAGAAALFASGRIALNVTIPSGYKMGVRHSVKVSGGASYATVDVVPLGGVVR
jgi:hypothetical protein